MPKTPENEGIHNITPENLFHFYGSQNYYRYNNIVLTDGAMFLVKNDCAWLMDVISSYQISNLPKESDGFQFWKLQKIENDPQFKAIVVCEDGNGKVLRSQKIEYTNFPFDRFEEGISLYLELGSIDGENLCWVCMLPGER
jgi:hypothetical protein